MREFLEEDMSNSAAPIQAHGGKKHGIRAISKHVVVLHSVKATLEADQRTAQNPVALVGSTLRVGLKNKRLQFFWVPMAVHVLRSVRNICQPKNRRI